MVKTFEHLQDDKDPSGQDSSPKVKTFGHLQQPAPAAPQAPTVKTFGNLQRPATPAPTQKTFENVTPKTEINPVRKEVQAVFPEYAVGGQADLEKLRQQYGQYLNEPGFEITEVGPEDLQRIRNWQSEIQWQSPTGALHYAAENIQGLHLMQENLNNAMQMPELILLGQQMRQLMDILEDIPISLLDPNSIRSKWSDFRHGAAKRVLDLRQDFQQKTEQMQGILRLIQPKLEQSEQALHQLEDIESQAKRVFDHLGLSQVALAHGIDQKKNEPADTSGFFNMPLEQLLGPWQRKLEQIKTLRQAALLTLPQVRLSRQNMLARIERIHQLRDVSLPLWKQQFLTALANSNADSPSVFVTLQQLHKDFRQQVETLV